MALDPQKHTMTFFINLFWRTHFRGYPRITVDIIEKSSFQNINWIDSELETMFLHFNFLQYASLKFGIPFFCLLYIISDKTQFDLASILIYSIFVFILLAYIIILKFNFSCIIPYFKELKDSNAKEKDFCNTNELEDIVIAFCKVRVIYEFIIVFFMLALTFYAFDIKVLAIIFILLSLLYILIYSFVYFKFYIALENLLIDKNKILRKKRK